MAVHWQRLRREHTMQLPLQCKLCAGFPAQRCPTPNHASAPPPRRAGRAGRAVRGERPDGGAAGHPDLAAGRHHQDAHAGGWQGSRACRAGGACWSSGAGVEWPGMLRGRPFPATPAFHPTPPRPPLPPPSTGLPRQHDSPRVPLLHVHRATHHGHGGAGHLPGWLWAPRLPHLLRRWAWDASWGQGAPGAEVLCSVVNRQQQCSLWRTALVLSLAAAGSRRA